MLFRVSYDDIKTQNDPLTLSDILPKLRNVKQVANGETIAACPYCEANRPDGHHLYLTEKSGYLEMFCHSCKTPQKTILEVLLGDGRQNIVSTPYIPKKTEKKSIDVVEDITYDYRNIDGTLAFRKNRKKYSDGSKKFSFIGPNNTFKKPDGSICIYGLEQLKDLNKNTTIYIVEGEKCVEAMKKHGFIALCSSNGANGAKFTDEEKIILSEFQNKVIIPDNDEPGNKYISLWDGVRVLPIINIWPDCPNKGDIADYFEQGLPANVISNYKFCDIMLPIYIGEKYKIEAGIGVQIHKKTKSGELFWDKICPHPIVPLRRFKDVYTGLEKYELAYFRDGAWKYHNVPSNELINSKLLQKHSNEGILISSRNAKDMAEYFNDYISSDLMKGGITYTSSRMGWFNNDFIPYTGNIKLDISSDDNDAIMRGSKPIGNLHNWIEAVRPLWQKSPELCMYMAIGAAAPIVGRLNLDTFVGMIYGKTGYGKTAMLKIVSSIFGLPNKNGLMFIMNGTINFMTKTMHTLKNVCMCIDENEARVNSKEGIGLKSPEAEWLYSISSNKGRQRMTSNGESEAPLTWSTTINITGEYPMTTEKTPEGAKNRIIEIELNDYLTDDFLPVTRAIETNYGHAISLIVKYILEIKDLNDELEKRYKKIMQINHHVTSKMANNGSVCMLAYDILEKILGKGALTNEKLTSYLKTNEDVDNIKVIYDFIIGWLAKRDSNIRWGADYANSDEGKLNQMNHIENTGEIIAIRHLDYYVVNKNALDNALMFEYGKGMKAYQKQMAERGWLLTRNRNNKVYYSDMQSIAGIRTNSFKIVY